MSNYSIGLQEAKGGYKVVLFSNNNGKLVLAGEVIKNQRDVIAVRDAIADAWANKRDIVDVVPGAFPASKKWPKNAGPAKKKAAQKKIPTTK